MNVEKIARHVPQSVHTLYTRIRTRGHSRLRVLLHACTLLCLSFAHCGAARGYSVQSHQQLIDLSWKSAIEPFLLARYPGLTAAQLREAHAYAYGGCAIQDLGYYPFGEEFFSNLLHYVRSGEFVQQLLKDANSPDELAFALGALSHYVGDSLGHSIATNHAVPVEFPQLRQQYGSWVTYDEDPHAHVQAEFAFDVDQISKGRFAPVAYLESVGLEVPVPLLSRSFETIYGIPLRDVLGGGQRPNLFGYRLAVHRLLPRIAAAEALLHGRDMPADTPGPGFDRMVQALRQSGYDNGWQQFRGAPDLGTRLLAGLVYLTPKIGAPTMLAIKGPTLATEQDYVRSMDRSIDTMNFLLATSIDNPAAEAKNLANRDLDTGQDVQPGAYRLTDQTYQRLLHRLSLHAGYRVSPALKQNIALYYRDRSAFGSHMTDKAWSAIQADREVLAHRSPPSSAGKAPGDSQGDESSFESMFANGAMSLVRMLLVGVLACLVLFGTIRMFRKRAR